MLGFAPERFSSEPGGPRLRGRMRPLAARVIHSLPTSLSCPTPGLTSHGSRCTDHGPRVAPHGTRTGPQICGAQYSIPNRFLIGTPKQLEIAVTLGKQNTAVVSNRDTNTTPSNAIRPSLVGLAGAPSASRSGRDRRAGFSQRALSRAARKPNQQTFSPSPQSRARQTPFLIGTPKRLKIAATPTKQSSRSISNRYKKRGSSEARFAVTSVAPDRLSSGTRLQLPRRRQISRHTKLLETPEVIENKAPKNYFAAQNGALYKSQLRFSPFPSSRFPFPLLPTSSSAEHSLSPSSQSAPEISPRHSDLHSPLSPRRRRRNARYRRAASHSKPTRAGQS